MAHSNPIAVGIDIGSAWSRVLFLQVTGQQVRYVAHGTAPGRGWVKGRVADPQALAESVKAAVLQAEAAGFNAEAAVAGVGGSGVDGASTRVLYEFGRKRTITRDDLVYAIDRATKLQMDDDRLILMLMPQDFTIDGRAGYLNPSGAQASRLEANVQVITASLQEHECLLAAIHESHLAVEESVFEGVAAAYASILAEERERGVVAIDIGAQSTELALYSGDALLASTSIPVGGDHFSGDLAYCLKVAFEDAARVKEEYGCARLGLVSDDNLIELPAHEGRAAREVRRGEVNEILEARAEELFGFIREEIENAGMARQLLEGAVLTGGGAQLPGMLDVAERVLECSARNGLPVGIADLPELLTVPEWTTAAGLALYSARLKSYKEGRSKPPGFLNMILR